MSALSAQFCFQLAFGVLLALAFVPRAPVGAFFYRLMGSAALVLLTAGVALRVNAGAPISEPPMVAAALAALAFPIYSGPLRGRLWSVGLGLGLLGTGAAVLLLMRQGMTDVGPGRALVAGLSALATGTVAGSVALAMVLGHWYLTVPNLELGHLARLNRVTIGSMLASLLFLGAVCLLFGAELASRRPPLLGPWGLFYLGTRVAVGLLVPLVFAWMTAGSIGFRNTRSATGILYASTVLVLIGTAASLWLQNLYGVPL